MKTSREDRIFDGQDGGQRFIVHQYACRPALRRIQRLAQNPGHRLAMIGDLGGEERLIVPVRSGIALAGNILSGKNRRDVWLQQRRGCIQRLHESMSVGREHWPGVQRVRKPRDEIVSIQSFTRDVLARAFMRNGLPCNSGSSLQAAASRRSHRNLAIRLFETASRYSADPR